MGDLVRNETCFLLLESEEGLQERNAEKADKPIKSFGHENISDKIDEGEANEEIVFCILKALVEARELNKYMHN